MSEDEYKFNQVLRHVTSSPYVNLIMDGIGQQWQDSKACINMQVRGIYMYHCDDRL